MEDSDSDPWRIQKEVDDDDDDLVFGVRSR